MHEGAIAKGILDTVLAALPARSPKPPKITKIHVVTGVFTGVERECLAMYLTELSKQTPADGAELHVQRRPAQLTCDSCGLSAPYDNTGDLAVRCTRCGSANRVEGGNELYVDSIEVDSED